MTSDTSHASTVRSATIVATFRESALGVKAILAGVFVSRLSGFLNVFLVLYLHSRGYPAGQSSVALGTYGVGALVGVFVGGALADRLGARNATVLSMTSAGALTASLLYLPGYSTVLAAVAVVGLGGQLYRPASSTLLSELTLEDRQIMIFAMHRFALNLGAMAAPLVGFGLYDLGHQGYTLLFWGEALVALAYAVLAWVALPAGLSRSADMPAGIPVRPDGGYLAVFRDRSYALFLVATLLHMAVYAQYLSTLPLDITAAGVPIFWYTVAVSLNGFIVIAFELLLTKLSQRWPAKLTIGLAFALLGTGVAFYGLPIGPAVILAATLIWTLGEIIGGPTIFAYPAVASPGHLRSRYIASFQFVFGLGTAVGPMVGGWLFIRIGHHVWPVLAIGSLIATVLVLFAVRAPARLVDTISATTAPTVPPAPAAPAAVPAPAGCQQMLRSTSEREDAAGRGA